MMDYNQAQKLDKNGSIDENSADTKKRFESMVSSPKMQGLLEKMGLTVADYADIIKT